MYSTQSLLKRGVGGFWSVLTWNFGIIRGQSAGALDGGSAICMSNVINSNVSCQCYLLFSMSRVKFTKCLV